MSTSCTRELLQQIVDARKRLLDMVEQTAAREADSEETVLLRRIDWLNARLELAREQAGG
jgi:hypothetical protein